MNKTSELNQVLSELKGCGKKLISIADSLKDILSSTDNESENAIEASPIPTEQTKEEYSFLDVRKKFVEVARAGHTEALKELLQKYGAEKLSSVDPSQYAAILADAEAIQ